MTSFVLPPSSFLSVSLSLCVSLPLSLSRYASVSSDVVAFISRFTHRSSSSSPNDLTRTSIKPEPLAEIRTGGRWSPQSLPNGKHTHTHTHTLAIRSLIYFHPRHPYCSPNLYVLSDDRPYSCLPPAKSVYTARWRSSRVCLQAGIIQYWPAWHQPQTSLATSVLASSRSTPSSDQQQKRVLSKSYHVNS